MKPAAHPASAPAALDRTALVARAQRLEYFTIAWNGFEAAVALVSGLLAGSIALVGFGLDSVIETISAGILLWRLRAEDDPLRRERIERTAHRLVGICFLLLAAYVAAESLRALWTKAQPERSIPGILIALAAVGRLLRLSLRDPAGRIAAACGVGLVVGRSGCRADHDANNRARGRARIARRRLRRWRLRTLALVATIWVVAGS